MEMQTIVVHALQTYKTHTIPLSDIKWRFSFISKFISMQSEAFLSFGCLYSCHVVSHVHAPYCFCCTMAYIVPFLRQTQKYHTPTTVIANNHQPHVQILWYIRGLWEAGGCLVVIAQWSEHWQLKPEALGSIPGGYWLFPHFSFLLHRICICTTM